MSPLVPFEIPGRVNPYYGYGYLSIVRKSPYNRPDDRRRYMALRGFFDGSFDVSDKTDDANKVVCLGGISANEDTWPSFERAWGLVLADLPELDFYWHTTDARRTLGPERFYAAANRLLRVIHDFRESDVPSPLITYSATIPIADYKLALAEIPSLRKLEAICVNAVIGRIVVPTDGDIPILIYFDENEEFMKHVEQVWRRARRRRRQRKHTHRERTVRRGWPWQIARIKAFDADDIDDNYALQAADLVAWVARRHRTDTLANSSESPQGEAAQVMALAMKLMVSTRHIGTTFNRASIVEAYPNG